ncbi:Uncharacterised protein [Acinetobacter baumannii]|nr:Uncharacterised protein [Acinetobacter baumannii]
MRQVAPNKIPLPYGKNGELTTANAGTGKIKCTNHNKAIASIKYDQTKVKQSSNIKGHKKFNFGLVNTSIFLINTCAPPIAQRKRCFHNPFKVSGIKIQTKAFGSKRMSQPARCNFQVISMSSVNILGDQ